MGIVNTKSTVVTNLDATPAKANNLNLMGARLRVAKGTVEIAAGDDDTSVYRMARVHSSWHINSAKVFHDSITGGTSFDLGLYDVAAVNSGAVVNADLFASGVDLSTGTKTGTELAFESGDTDVANVEKAIWQLLGLSSDPNKYYDLALTGNTVGSGAGTVSLVTEYTDGN